jgi:hypothetical protein
MISNGDMINLFGAVDILDFVAIAGYLWMYNRVKLGPGGEVCSESRGSAAHSRNQPVALLRTERVNRSVKKR